MDYYSWQFIIWATSLGALSAISLPMGSLVALRTNPRPQFISILAAFGVIFRTLPKNNVNFAIKNKDIGGENGYFLNDSFYISK